MKVYFIRTLSGSVFYVLASDVSEAMNIFTHDYPTYDVSEVTVQGHTVALPLRFRDVR